MIRKFRLILNEIKIKKVDIMKNKKTKLSMNLSVLLICFLLCASALNIQSTKALLEGEQDQYLTDSSYLSTWKWNTTDVVSTGSTEFSEVPSLDIDTAGNIHIAWRDFTDYAGAGPDGDIFYKQWDSTSSTWTSTEVVSTESTAQSYNPSLGVDSAGDVHIAWEDWTDYAGAGSDRDIFYKRKNASSLSWTTTEIVSTESTGDSWDPSLAVDSAGDIHVAWGDQTDYAGSGTDWDIFYKRWDSSISSWTTTEVVSTESTLASWESSLAVDSAGNVHIGWQDVTDYAGAGIDDDIFYKRWDAFSSSWTTTEVVSVESTGDTYYPSLGVDSVGNVFLVWQDTTNYAGAGTDQDIFYRRRDASYSSWATTEVVSTESTVYSEYPSLTVDFAGNVHVAWVDLSNYDGSGTDHDIFYKRRNAPSSSWTLTEVVSTESSSNSDAPSLVVDINSNIHVTWQDTTYYAGSGGDKDIFYKRSIDPPVAPTLAFIVPNPIELTDIFLDWNSVFGATTYYLYRSTSFIWSVEGIIPIATVSVSEYNDILPSEGFYYYVVVAENFAGNSSLSNCQYIEYKLPSLDEFVIVSSLILGTFVVLFVVMRIRKKKPKPN